MNTDDVVGASDVDRGGIRAIAPAPSVPRSGHRSASAVAAVPDSYVRTWEAAYRKYGQVIEMAARMSADDPAAAWQMATASWQVAAAWREITLVGRLPWWLLAAVESAAEAFEAQARDWEAREAAGTPDEEQ